MAVESEKLVVEITGHDAVRARCGACGCVALVGMIMAGVGVGLIARRYRRSPAVAVALGIANPLVLLHLLGGSHNDALMIGLPRARVRRVPARAQAARRGAGGLATGVKLTAAPALVFMAWNWSDDPAVTYARRIRDSALVVGGRRRHRDGPVPARRHRCGWIAALKSTGKSVSTYSLPTKFGYIAVDVLQWVGIGLHLDDRAGHRRVPPRSGLAAAGLISLVLLLRSPRIGLVRAFAFSSLAIVMLGPVVWPWYLATGFALLAASGVGKWRPTYSVMLVAATALVWPASISPLASIQHYQNGISPLVIASVLAICWAGQRLATRRRQRPPPTPDRTSGRRGRSDGPEPVPPVADAGPQPGASSSSSAPGPRAQHDHASPTHGHVVAAP